MGVNLTGFALNADLSVEYRFRRSVAQPGSAPALGAGGPRFESLYSDHTFPYCSRNTQHITAHSSAG